MLHQSFDHGVTLALLPWQLTGLVRTLARWTWFSLEALLTVLPK